MCSLGIDVHRDRQRGTLLRRHDGGEREKERKKVAREHCRGFDRSYSKSTTFLYARELFSKSEGVTQRALAASLPMSGPVGEKGAIEVYRGRAWT